MSIVRKILNFKVPMFALVICLVFSAAIVAGGYYVIVKYITPKKIEAGNQEHKAEIAQLKNDLAEWSQEYNKVLAVRNSYRDNIKEIFELLYNKDTYLGIGGAATPVENDDTVSLLKIKTLVSTLEDDLKMMEGVKTYLTARRQFADNFPFVWPIDREGVPRVSSGYGFRNDSEVGGYQGGGIHFHEGIDIPGSRGEDILATADGKVEYKSEEHWLYGKVVIIRHNYDFQTYYCHLDKVFVKNGQEVKRGDVIGTMGNTGKAMGYHLHYEVRRNNVSMDPMIFLNTNF
jgi:murein DD-endopeptidase MepM/ murein hydrolase activator NlpD